METLKGNRFYLVNREDNEIQVYGSSFAKPSYSYKARKKFPWFKEIMKGSDLIDITKAKLASGKMDYETYCLITKGIGEEGLKAKAEQYADFRWLVIEHAVTQELATGQYIVARSGKRGWKVTRMEAPAQTKTQDVELQGAEPSLDSAQAAI